MSIYKAFFHVQHWGVTYSVTPQFYIVLELFYNVPKNAERFLLSLAEGQMVLPLTEALDVLFCL
jgi:hypothetical protein